MCTGSSLVKFSMTSWYYQKENMHDHESQSVLNKLGEATLVMSQEK